MNIRTISILLLAMTHFSFAQAPTNKTEKIYVMHGKLDSAWGGGPAESSQVTYHKYLIVKGGIGEFQNNFVGISFGSRTLSGNEPENAIIIMTLWDYNELQNIQSFQVIGMDASIGLLEYEDGLWERLVHMSQDELLAYCTPTNPVSFDVAVNTAIEYVKYRWPEATAVRLKGNDTPENCRDTLTWSLGIRAEFIQNETAGPYEHIVEVNDNGIVVSYHSY